MRKKKKPRWYSSSRLLEGSRACRAWAVASLRAVTFLSSSCWLRWTAVDQGVWLTHHIMSAPVRTPENPRPAHAPSPSLRTHTLIPSHPSSADAPAAGTPRLSAHSTTPTSRGCRLTLTHRQLRPIVGPVYLTYLINKDKLRRPSGASLLSHKGKASLNYVQ